MTGDNVYEWNVLYSLWRVKARCGNFQDASDVWAALTIAYPRKRYATGNKKPTEAPTEFDPTV
jgi:hypothetical protein